MTDMTPPPAPPAPRPNSKPGEDAELPFQGAGMVVGILLSPMLLLYNFRRLFRLYSMIPLVRIGIILVLLGIPVLFANEVYIARKVARLGGMLKDVVLAEPDKVNPAHEGKLVYVAGTVTSKGPLLDPDTGVSTPAVRLVRTVEMYQWKETKGKKATSDKPATPASYDRVWSEQAINSKSFDDRTRENPPMTLSSKSIAAQPATVGPWSLSEALVGQIPAEQPLEWTAPLQAALPEAMRAQAKVNDSKLYLGDPNAPRIGDIRISYTFAASGPVSILAGQQGTALQTYTSDNGEMEVLLPGTHTAAALVGQAQSRLGLFAWIGRILGFLIILLGFLAFFKPSAVLMSMMEFIGWLFTLGVPKLTFILSIWLTLLVIGAGWGLMHPGLGTVVFIAVAALVAWGLVMARQMPAIYKKWEDSATADEPQTPAPP